MFIAIVIIAVLAGAIIIGSRFTYTEDAKMKGKSLRMFDPTAYTPGPIGTLIPILIPELSKLRSIFLAAVRQTGWNHGYNNYRYIHNRSDVFELEDTAAMEIYKEAFALGQAERNKLKEYYSTEKTNH